MSKKKPQPRSSYMNTCVDYWEKLSFKDKQWLKQFNDEYYNNGIYKAETPILNTPELVREANRNYNNLKRDALELVTRQDSYGDLSKIDKEFMEAASDEWDWRDAFKIGGEELAGHVIFMITIRELLDTVKDPYDKWPLILARLHIRMRHLNRFTKQENRK